MLLSFLGIKASGLKRNHIFFVMLARLFRRSFKNVQRFLLSFLLLSSLIIFLFFSNKPDNYFQASQDWLADLTITAMYYIQTPFRYFTDYCRTHSALRNQIEVLSLENQRLRLLENQAISYQRENEQLRKLANVVSNTTLETITVRILGNPSDHLSSSLVIERKQDLNLQKDQVVMSKEGIIGRIHKVGIRSARVLLITDSRSRIPARIASTGEHVILVGNNTEELKVLHTDATSALSLQKPKEGDLLVTSGFGGIYPPNLPIGRISSVTNAGFKAKVLSTNYQDYVTLLKDVLPPDHDIHL